MPSTKNAKGLGRDFGSLIPKDLDAVSLINEGERIQNIALENLRPEKSQPRTIFDETSLDELAQSIKKYGIIQPLVVTPIGDNKYSIIAGERRWRAAQKANLKQVPVIVRTAEALEKLEIALIENVQRVDLSPLEQAVSIERLHQQFNMSYVDIAKRLGKAPPTINNMVRLMQLPEAAREALRANIISEGHARSILALKSKPNKQQELLDNIINKHWSVRQAEQFVLESKDTTPKKKAYNRLATKTPETTRLEKKLKTTVSLRRMAKGGKLEIGFNDDDELKRIVEDIL